MLSFSGLRQSKLLPVGIRAEEPSLPEKIWQNRTVRKAATWALVAVAALVILSVLRGLLRRVD